MNLANCAEFTLVHLRFSADSVRIVVLIMMDLRLVPWQRVTGSVAGSRRDLTQVS
jgi:hypothetical protein